MLFKCNKMPQFYSLYSVQMQLSIRKVGKWLLNDVRWENAPLHNSVLLSTPSSLGPSLIWSCIHAAPPQVDILTHIMKHFPHWQKRRPRNANTVNSMKSEAIIRTANTIQCLHVFKYNTHDCSIPTSHTTPSCGVWGGNIITWMDDFVN